MGHYDSCREAWTDKEVSAVQSAWYAPKTCNSQYIDTSALENLFEKQRVKLLEKRKEGRSGWNNKEDCSQQYLSNLLHKAVEKGDVVSVANYCAFLNAREESILPFKVIAE